MRFFIFFGLLVPFVFISCKQDDGFLLSEGNKLIRHFDKMDGFYFDHTYSYDHSGNMTMYKFDINGEKSIIFEYFYDEENRVKKALRNDYPPDSNLGKIEYFYDQLGRLNEVVSFYSNDWGDSFNLANNSVKYYYGSDGNVERLERIIRDFDGSQYYSPYAFFDIFYKWENGNIVKEEYYNSEGIRALTMKYEYDTKPNFRKNLPPYITWPLYQTQNNIVRKIYIDHLGHYGRLVCTDCRYRYKYNRKGFPVEYFKTANSDRVYTMTYQ